MTQTYEAPPDKGGDFEKRFDGQSKTFSEVSSKRAKKQQPRHIGDIAAKVFVDTCERQVLRQIEKLSNPAFGGSARVEAQEYLAALLVIYGETAGRPWSTEVAA